MIQVNLLYHFLIIRTFLGRHIYAVGGNSEWTKLSGISVQKITFVVFSSMGMLAVLSGVQNTSRQHSTMMTVGTHFELYAISAAYVGGVLPSGRVAKLTGSLIGANVMISLMLA